MSQKKYLFDYVPIEANCGSQDWIARIYLREPPQATVISCTVVPQQAIRSQGQGLKKIPECVRVIKDIIGSEHGSVEKFCHPFLSTLAKLHDHRGISMSVIFTKTNIHERAIVDLGWKHEPISQLRVRICGVLPQTKDWGTVKCITSQIAMLANQDEEWKCQSDDDTEPSLTITPTIPLQRQLKEYHPESVDDPAFHKFHKLGAFATKPENKPIDTWASWIHDDARHSLRVNRVVVRRPLGNALDLLGILQQCLDHSQVAAEDYNVVVWDPSEEMYHAAIALADDEKIGRFFQVYKEPIDGWKAYVRWHPEFVEKPVWKERQFYCFPGSLEGE